MLRNIIRSLPRIKRPYSSTPMLSLESLFFPRFDSNSELVDYLSMTGTFTDPAVSYAMKAVDRGDFAQSNCYVDSPQPIGYSATISAPHVHAAALEYLMPCMMKQDARVLDVGCGSGYLCTLFARANTSAKVVGIDYIPELVDLSRTNIEKRNKDLLDSGRVTLVVGNGWEGYEEMAPYDCIHVGAAAPTEPQALISQLKLNGLMIIPIGEEMGVQTLKLGKRIATSGSHQMEWKGLMHVRYVPLVQPSQTKD